MFTADCYDEKNEVTTINVVETTNIMRSFSNSKFENYIKDAKVTNGSFKNCNINSISDIDGICNYSISICDLVISNKANIEHVLSGMMRSANNLEKASKTLFGGIGSVTKDLQSSFTNGPMQAEIVGLAKSISANMNASLTAVETIIYTNADFIKTIMANVYEFVKVNKDSLK